MEIQILLDLMLPGIDGYQVCRELRATSRCRSLCSPQKVRFSTKVLGLGADDYMIKPFDSKELVAGSRRYCAAITAPAPAAPEPPESNTWNTRI